MPPPTGGAGPAAAAAPPTLAGEVQRCRLCGVPLTGGRHILCHLCDTLSEIQSLLNEFRLTEMERHAAHHGVVA
eukprot:6111442-Lingulodinium_polyedra.AAC.1